MIKENGTILIPIDFSKHSIIGLMNSYNIARYTNSKILLISSTKNTENENIDELKQLCNKAHEEAKVPCDYKIVNESNLLQKILKLSDEMNASLIIMGLNPAVRFTSFLGLGKYSSFLKKLKCPIITCRATNFISRCETIVMPLDLSPESREKVDTTCQLANFYDAEIKIISVFSSRKPFFEDSLLPYLHQVKRKIKQKKIFCSNRSIASENVTSSIIEYAGKSNADLIIQMNERNSNILKWLKGTDSMNIIDDTSIPVLTINPIKRASISTGVH